MGSAAEFWAKEHLKKMETLPWQKTGKIWSWKKTQYLKSVDSEKSITVFFE